MAGCLARGWSIPSFDAVVDSTIPLGGGLSSSAALEVATATLLEALCGEKLPPVAKALLCQQAEHEYAGMPCGIMDQFASVMAQADALLLLDCRSQVVTPVPMADPAVTVLIVNSRVKHELAAGESPYAQRRADCESAARALGVPALRDATAATLMAAFDRLSPTVFRRARHVIGENARTLAAADAARHGDWQRFGELMVASHESLRDDFEVSCPELDLLVNLALELSGQGGVYGSRMTGGGFGGCTVSIVRSEQLPSIARHLADGYRRQTGIVPEIFATRPAAGARLVPVD